MLTQNFRMENARILHRTFTNTITVPTEQNNSLTPVNDEMFFFVAEDNQAVFTGVDENGNTLAFTPGRIEVFLNGERLDQSEYVTNAGTQIELLEGCDEDDVLTIVTFNIYTFPNPSDYYYVFLGRTLPWENDAVPPDPENTRIDEASTKNNIIAVKKVGMSDVCLVVPRINWVDGTTYSSFDDDEDFSSRPFYVMNTGYRVYKCLFTPGTPSTVEPVHTATGPFYLEDGYCWQLIYEIPAADRSKFLDERYIPVKFFSTSSTFDHNAIIDSINVVDGGTGFVSIPTIIILGDGVGAEATASISGGSVTGIEVTKPGYGYTWAIIQTVGGGGSGVVAEATLQTSDMPSTVNQNVASYAFSTAGALDRLEVLAEGDDYLPGTTTLVVEGDGEGATVSPIINIQTGRMTGAQILDRGRGYTFANIVVKSTTGFGAVIKAVVGPEYGHGGDIPRELFSTTVAISVNIEDSWVDFFADNDFRQIGIIKNIKDFYNDGIFSSKTGTACYIAEVPSGDEGEYNVDDVISTDTGGRYVVTNRRGQDVYLLPQIDSIFESSILNNQTTGENGLTIDVLSQPEFSRRSGAIIYVKNSTPINREQGQIEQLELFIRF